MESGDDERPSRSQRKRDMLALQALGERLVDLPVEILERIPLPPDLFDAVMAARSITAHGGRKRQLQYIGRLMREVESEPIRTALAELDGRGAVDKAAFRAAERWRTLLLDDGDDAITEFLDHRPDTDRQHLRRLVRDARAESDAGRPPRHRRELFRYLHTLLQ